MGFIWITVNDVPFAFGIIFCCGYMLLLIFIFTWHPVKEKIPGKQVSRGLLYKIYSVFHFLQYQGKIVQFLDADVLLYTSYESEDNYSTKLFVWGVKKNYSLIVHFPKECSLLLHLNFLPYWELFLCCPFWQF